MSGGLGLPSSKLTALDSTLRRALVNAVNSVDLSHAEIARRAGLHRTTVSNVINGRRAGTVDTWDLILTAAGAELVPANGRSGVRS